MNDFCFPLTEILSKKHNQSNKSNQRKTQPGKNNQSVQKTTREYKGNQRKENNPQRKNQPGPKKKQLERNKNNSLRAGRSAVLAGATICAALRFTKFIRFDASIEKY